MASLQSFVFLLCGVVLASAGVKPALDRSKFREFLERSVNGVYEKSVTPELAELQSDWERSGKFEGDIVLTPEQIDALVNDYMGERNGILNTNMLWTNKTLYYTISPDFDAAQVAVVERGLADLASVSCLKFVKRTALNPNYVHVESTDLGCYSRIGMIGGNQTLNLEYATAGSGCFRTGVIVHEFLHALGFFHMQSTQDRDEYVKIVWDKIEEGQEHNFHKYSSTNLGVEYDYCSLMHYPENAFSIDGSKTIIPLKPTNENIGQCDGMTRGDIIKLNKLYKCPGF